MPLPPIEEAPQSMTRRNYIVELNRLRVKAHEPIRRALEDEDLRIAREREEAQKKRVNSWKSQISRSTRGTRQLPGGAPRSAQLKEMSAVKNPNMLNIIKEEEAQRKAERVALAKADMKQQIKERDEFLRESKKQESMYDKSLQESAMKAAQILDERDKERVRTIKECVNRMQEINAKETEQKRMKQKALEEYERSYFQIVKEIDDRKVAEEKARAENAKRLIKLENEENCRISVRKQKEDRERDEKELRALLEYNNALAERERENEIRKREQYKREFEEVVAKQKAIKEMCNVDESPDSCRKKIQQDLASLALINSEERLRLANRRRQYRDDLMRQIREKFQWRLEHLDGV